MIISASYRTDIPAFYGDWFMRRLAAGACQAVNPWNRKPYTVSLKREDVDGFVLWTRNLAPFVGYLPAIAESAPFYVQYTVTGYPHALERSVVATERAIADIRNTARIFGPFSVVWRYDPIVVTTLTPISWHLDNFRLIAKQLQHSTNEVTISFMHSYRKTRKNIDAAARQFCFEWREPDREESLDLVAALTGIADEHGMRLTVCSQPAFVVGGAEPAACIDAARLSIVSGEALSAPIKGNRPDCLCNASRDIGAYDTCPHGCAYCYAVSGSDAAKANHAAHNPASDLI
ncbi:MAG: DUF1848 domain-containing protein [Alphaproteobacteria bacterium]|jgi:hypothetical protein|nr:DUF1848 domain-containing protein [Alphaproteobacteria bacterium]